MRRAPVAQLVAKYIAPEIRHPEEFPRHRSFMRIRLSRGNHRSPMGKGLLENEPCYG
jgi:hypothetical protein